MARGLEQRARDADIELSDPEVEVHAVTLGIEGRHYQGHDGLRQWMRDIRDRFGARSETKSIEPLADDAVLLNGAVFVTDDYGREEEQRVAMVVHLKDGKARWVGTFFSATDARSAFKSGVTGPGPG
jgi:ketosteroid isomerase-like protein